MLSNARKTKRKPFTKHILFLWVCAILVNVKSIFADYDIDSAYAVVMSYRHLTGDKMFLQMWEPHQTSCFLADLLLYPFLKATGSVQGAVLWLQFWGVITYAAVTVIFFRFLKKYIDPSLAHYICIFFFTIRAKQIVFPEFSNMMICFSVLMFMSFYTYLTVQDNHLYLVISSILLCLEILSYPSSILTAIFLISFILIYSSSRIQDIIIFISTCFTFGGVYFLYFGLTLGFHRFVHSLLSIAQGDSSHSVAKIRNLLAFTYNRDFYYGLILLLICFIAATFLCRCIKCISISALTISLFLLAEVFYIISFTGDGSSPYYSPAILFPCVIILGLKNITQCSSALRQMVWLGIGISVCSLLAVIILSNLSFIAALWYTLLAVCVSFIPLWTGERSTLKKTHASPLFSPLILFLLLILIHRGLISTDTAYHSDIFHLRSIYKSGPERGIVSSYFPAYQSRTDQEEWPNAVYSDDHLLVVGGSPICYMYSPVSISHYSTICTPTYNDHLLEYWKDNPEKYPTVIALECWYGEPHIDSSSWIYQWVNDNFEISYEGTFWRFYRPKQTSITPESKRE